MADHHPDYEPSWATLWSPWHFDFIGRGLGKGRAAKELAVKAALEKENDNERNIE